MHPRFYVFLRAARGSGAWTRLARSQTSQFVCRTCRSNFSTSPILRQVAGTGERRYPRDLVIYQAGDLRTSWLAMWKAVCMLQFGTVLVFITPRFYNNKEQQPNKAIRVTESILITLIAGVLPMLTLTYLTSPFVKRIHMQIPSHATTSRQALAAFTSSLPPTTRLRFVTLRAYPIEKTTTVQLSELRAMNPKRTRFANIERIKGEIWKQGEVGKRWWEKTLDILGEPRWLFHVKEGRAYTISTGVPGVWDDVAAHIKRQSGDEIAVRNGKRGGKRVALLPAKKSIVQEFEKKRVLRTTTRKRD
ncbi:hypothetical protein P154DRAFT_620398 [Amniculicola lignicola CBS 123094]|uniref:Uncharacterized protein n=1 Tax=Amniculicola lignicola CBS 123094 TaxID=1392246 RepID=A0A6A5WEJ6_9PLEO|nr:hypothetical protein P154DRAFT_620398 [Amniculicola lignicola CBS 123094]